MWALTLSSSGTGSARPSRQASASVVNQKLAYKRQMKLQQAAAAAESQAASATQANTPDESAEASRVTANAQVLGIL